MTSVTVALYDLSQGMAASLSAGILGRQIDGIWHTGIIVFGREYYFGGGICADAPGQTPYGRPIRTYPLGNTQKTEPEFRSFLASVSGRFSMMTYDLLTNNCNNFSDACAMFLTDSHIPQYILDLPNDALNSPMGPMLRNMLQSAQGAIRDQSLGHEVQLDGQPPSASPPAAAGTPTRKHKSAKLWTTPTIMQRANRAAIISKMRELTPDVPADGGVTPLLDAVVLLSPADAFPALDLLRLEGLKDSSACRSLAAGVPRLLAAFCADGSPAARPSFMMSLRCAVNCFQFADASAVLLQPPARESVIAGAVDGLNHAHAGVQKAGAVLALNVVGAQERNPSKVPPLDVDDYALLLSALCEMLAGEKDAIPESVAEFAIPTLAVLVDADEEAAQMTQAFGAEVARYAEEGGGYSQKTMEAAKIVVERLSEKK